MFSSNPAGSPLVHVIARNWWMWLIRGIAAVIFGILAWIWPGLTWITIAILFGAYALVDGIFAIVGTVRAAESHQTWWPFLLEGISGNSHRRGHVLRHPDHDYGALSDDRRVAFLTGIFELLAAVQLRKHISNEIWLIIGGLASIAFGVLMIMYPLIGALTIIYIIAAYAVVFGFIMIGLSLRLRSHLHATTPA